MTVSKNPFSGTEYKVPPILDDKENIDKFIEHIMTSQS